MGEMIIGAVIQARMSSNRFPGKVMYEVCGRPLLGFLLESLSKCNLLDAIVVATSKEDSDSVTHEYCTSIGVQCHRGSLDDVAGRFVEVIDRFNLDAFVRLCGDSPLLDHRLVDKAVSLFTSGKYDIVTNVLPRTFPKGQSVEIINCNFFKSAYPFMKTVEEREHVTSYFYNRSHQFTIYNLATDEALENIQMSVDIPEDMHRFERIINGMKKPHWRYGYSDLMNIFLQQERESE